jgi:hypothetical protein
MRDHKKPSKYDIAFLREILRWQGIASSQDLGPRKSYPEVKARGRCKSKGWVTFDGRGGYWRITDAGRALVSLQHSTSGE